MSWKGSVSHMAAAFTLSALLYPPTDAQCNPTHPSSKKDKEELQGIRMQRIRSFCPRRNFGFFYNSTGN